MMVATVAAAGADLALGTPTTLFEGRFVTVTNPSGDRWYDVTPDGQRFLMLKADDVHHLVRIQNWFEELKTLVQKKWCAASDHGEGICFAEQSVFVNR